MNQKFQKVGYFSLVAVFLLGCQNESTIPDDAELAQSDAGQVLNSQSTTISCGHLENIISSTGLEYKTSALSAIAYREMADEVANCSTSEFYAINAESSVDELQVKLLLANILVRNNFSTASQDMEYIESSLDHRNSEIRMLSAQLIGNLGGDSKIDALSEMISHDELDVALSASAALYALGTKSATARNELSRNLRELSADDPLRYKYVSDIIKSFDTMNPTNQ